MMSNMPAALLETDGSRLPSARGGPADSARTGSKSGEFAAMLADRKGEARAAEKPSGARSDAGSAADRKARKDAGSSQDAAGRAKARGGEDTADRARNGGAPASANGDRTAADGDRASADGATSGAGTEKDSASGTAKDPSAETAQNPDSGPETEAGPGAPADTDTVVAGPLDGQPSATEDLASGNVLPLTGQVLPPAETILPLGFALRAPASAVVPGLLDPQAAAALLDADLPPAVAGGTDGPESLHRMLEMIRGLNGLPGHFREQLQGEMSRKPGPSGLEFVEAARAGTLAGNSTLQASTGAAPLANLAAQTGTTTPTPPSLPISVAPGRPDWGDAIGQRVLWMVSNKAQEAELRLNPSELGRVDVKVRVDEDGLRLSFAAGNSAVREALEAAAPRLREMFQAEGLRLENMDIGQQHAGAGERSDAESHGFAANGGADGEEDTLPGASAAARASLGLVDLFV